MKEDIASYAAEVLKPRFNTREVSKEDYKWVLRKTVEKASLSKSFWMPLSHCLVPDAPFSTTIQECALCEPMQLHTVPVLTAMPVAGTLVCA